MSDERGRPPSVTDEEILSVFQEHDDPILTADEVAEALSVGRRGMLTRLKSLADENKLKSKKVGGRSIVWWSPKYTVKNDC